MQIRHRIPTIFSIYMVDVLCCALGCVVLLWQMYHYESEEQAAAKQTALDKLQQANVSLGSLSTEIDALNVKLKSSQAREVQLTLQLDDARGERDKERKLALVYKQDYDDAKKAEAVAKKAQEEARNAEALALAVIAKLETLNKSLNISVKDLTKQNQAADLTILEKSKQGALLAQKLADSLARALTLEKDLEARRNDVTATAKKFDEQKKMLQEVLLRSVTLEQDLDKTRKELLAADKSYQELALTQDLIGKKFTFSAKELADAKALISGLKGENLALLAKARALQLADINRFAGITLTGNKIVFLVDMSGSMELIDENTPDPDKWPIVCETIGKILRSLPEVKHFQVVLFSDKIRYPLGNERRWLDYSPDHSAKALVEALKAVKPKGGTNLYAGFEEAFKFRELGLDTIYVISDGLPTEGGGLPANAATLTDAQKGDLLSRHLRTRLKDVWNRPIAGSPRIRINSVGFFYESPDLGAFLWALAREHDGSFVGMSKP